MKGVRVFITIVVFLCCIGYGYSQEAKNPLLTPAPGATETQNRIMLAESEPGYPITPGDVFNLSYVSSIGTQSLPVTVEGDYTLNMGVLGTINAQNLTLAELRGRMKAAVTRAYPGSYPKVLITQTGAFTVLVTGEVDFSYRSPAWGMTRLSEVLTDHLTQYSSLRDVRITHRNNRSEEYDLYRAMRYGEISEDPYLKPGDIISLNKAAKIVEISGNVKRPGPYQLLSEDTLSELLYTYADGFAPGADITRITVQRRHARDSIDEIIKVDLNQTDAKSVILQDADSIEVPDREDTLPVVYFEGALQPDEKIRYALKQGDTMFRALNSIKEFIAPGADLSAAVVIKPGSQEQAPADLEKLLYSSAHNGDFVLVPGMRVKIPYGTHEVFISGEVTAAGWYSVEPLFRLSEVTEDKLTSYSSIRDIEIVTAEGRADNFDLFRAERFGEIEEDPYLSPGDIITVRRIERLVTIQGQVERPGTYQLLTGESLKHLVDLYGSGFTKMADPEEVELVRYDTHNGSVAETIYIDCTDSNWSEFTPKDLDKVIVPAKTRKLPFVLFEGAVYRERSLEDGTTLETSNRVQYTFEDGELLSTAVQNLKPYFTEVSDLKKAYIMHAGGEMTPIDIELLLFRQPDARDIELSAFDRIIIPFRQFFVIVSGAVMTPGRYPFIPDRTYEYYIDLAGGFDPERHTGKAVTITDINNNLISTEEYIQPETKIVAPNNNPLYMFGRISGILSTIISITTLVITLLR